MTSKENRIAALVKALQAGEMWIPTPQTLDLGLRYVIVAEHLEPQPDGRTVRVIDQLDLLEVSLMREEPPA